MAGGPMMNVFLAVILLGSVFMLFGVSKPTLTVSQVSDCVQPANVAALGLQARSDPDSPARAAGFRAGDQIVSVDGTTMTSWDQFSGVDPRLRRQADHRRRRAGRTNRVVLHADPTVNTLSRPTTPPTSCTPGSSACHPTRCASSRSSAT